MARTIAIYFLINLCVSASLCQKPCTVYDADTGKIVTNYTSVERLRVDCSMRELYIIPEHLPKRTYILDLHGNKITFIPAFIFKPYINMTQLDLSDNWISDLEPNSFGGLTKLEVLNLGGNNLCLPHSYKDGVFTDLNALRVLKTYSNHCPQRHRSIPDQVFKDLVSLEKLSLDATDKQLFFGSGFKQLFNLTHLEVSSYNSCMNYQTIVQNQSFDSLRNSKLTHLTLRGCAYQDIEKEAFSNLPYLNTLNTACAWNIKIDSLFEAVYQANALLLETLILDGMLALPQSAYQKVLKTLDQKSSFRFLRKLSADMTSDLTVSPFCHSKFQNLKRLSVRENFLFTKLSLENSNQSCLPNLDHINIGMNFIFDLVKYTKRDFEEARDIIKFGLQADYFWSLHNIRTVDASRLFYNTGYHSNWFCSARDLDTEDFFRKPPKFIEEIPDIENNFNVLQGKVKSKGSINVTDLESFEGVVHTLLMSPGTQVFFADHAVPDVVIDPGTTNVCPYVIYPYDTVSYFNISHNPLDLLTCPVLGAKSIRVIDASFCSLTSVHPQTYWPNITLLYLRGNQLNNTYDFPALFGVPNQLRELDLAQNNFLFLPGNSFKELIYLEKLDLSHNSLTTVNLALKNLTKLAVLDLSFNMISYLQEPFMKQVDFLHRRNPKFRILLHGNPFTCSCDSIPFLNWLKTTNVSVENIKTKTCPNSTTLLIKVNLKKLASHCKVSYFMYCVIIGSLSTVVLFVTVLSLVTYKVRWKIAWHIYTWKRRVFHNENHTLSENVKLFKAFVAYHIDHEIGNDPGITWVKNSLCHYVEEELGHRLFVFDRNAAFGGSKIGETIYGIQESEKVIFVITATYLEKGNWEMVLYWALAQGLSNVIMCCLEDLDIDKLPIPLAKVAIQLQEKYPTHYLFK